MSLTPRSVHKLIRRLSQAFRGQSRVLLRITLEILKNSLRNPLTVTEGERRRAFKGWDVAQRWGEAEQVIRISQHGSDPNHVPAYYERLNT